MKHIHTKQDVTIAMTLIKNKIEKIRIKINKSPLARNSMYTQFETEFRKMIKFFRLNEKGN